MNIDLGEQDTVLMLRMREGEEWCMDALAQRYRQPVIQYIHRKVKNHAIAEELTQNVFIRIFLARHTYEPTAKFHSWLFRIAYNLSLNWLRDNKREYNMLRLNAGMERDCERPIADTRPNVAERLLRESELAEIRRAIEELPSRQRDAVILHKYKELEYREIAAVMGCTLQIVKSLIFRAHEALRSRLSHMSLQGCAPAVGQRDTAEGALKRRVA